jgi:cystathionine gamma-synthase
MVSFEIDGGEPAVRAFVENLRYFSLAESLGGVESLVCHPASMTHAPVSEERKIAAGVTPTLVRLSIGLESVEDLLEDLLGALEAAARAPQLAAVATASGC